MLKKNNSLIYLFLLGYLFLGIYLSINTGISHDEYHEQLNWEVNLKSIKDFVKFSEIIGFKIFKSLALKNKNITNINNSNLFFKNLFGELGIFLIEK